MALSIFNRLYAYRQREGTNNRENFLIELLAYALEHHQAFCEGFVALVGLSHVWQPSQFMVSTQSVYLQGRPDLELQLSENCVVLIECKVESSEGHEQLTRYQQILDSKKEKTKQLIYLTKYVEPKGESVINLRWFQVVDLLKAIERSEMLNEFLKYLLEEEMDTTDFNIHDLSALLYMQDVMRKMDEVLDRIVPLYAKEFDAPLKDRTSRSYAMNQKGWYGDIKYLNNSYFLMAFRKQSPDGWPEIFVEFAIKNHDQLKSDDLTLWCQEMDYVVNKDTGYHYCGRYKNLLTLAQPGQEITEVSVQFFEEHLKALQAAKTSWRSLC